MKEKGNKGVDCPGNGGGSGWEIVMILVVVVSPTIYTVGDTVVVVVMKWCGGGFYIGTKAMMHNWECGRHWLTGVSVFQITSYPKFLLPPLSLIPWPCPPHLHPPPHFPYPHHLPTPNHPQTSFTCLDYKEFALVSHSQSVSWICWHGSWHNEP